MGAKTSTINQNSRTNDQSSAGTNETSIQSFSSLQTIPSSVGLFQSQLQSDSQSHPSRVSGDSRLRARSLSSVPDVPTNQGTIVTPLGVGLSQVVGMPPMVADNMGDDNSRVFAAHSLPSHIWSVNGLRCPVCSKFILPDDIECHLVICLTKPRLGYNEDVLSDEKGECVICLEDLHSGDVIARLPCLCIYHKNCIDKWFQVNRCCPEHPGD